MKTHLPYNSWDIEQDGDRVKIFRRGHGIDPLTFVRLLYVIGGTFVRHLDSNWIFRNTNDQWEADIVVLCTTENDAARLCKSLKECLCPACGSLHEFGFVNESITEALTRLGYKPDEEKPLTDSNS